MKISEATNATIEQTTYYTVERTLPLAQHLFVLFIHEAQESEAKYEIHYHALKVVARPPQKVSELKILDRLLDTMENMFHHNEYEITQEFVKYCFLEWYVGGDWDLYCKKCRIDGPEQKRAEKAKLYDKFEQNGDPCKILFDNFCLLEANLGTRTQNKLKIMQLLKDATQQFFEKLGKVARNTYSRGQASERAVCG
jgi:hypothetical protein